MPETYSLLEAQTQTLWQRFSLRCHANHLCCAVPRLAWSPPPSAREGGPIGLLSPPCQRYFRTRSGRGQKSPSSGSPFSKQLCKRYTMLEPCLTRCSHRNSRQACDVRPVQGPAGPDRMRGETGNRKFPKKGLESGSRWTSILTRPEPKGIRGSDTT